MSSSAIQANELAILSAGRNPVWAEQVNTSPTEWTSPPSTDSAGVTLGGATAALVALLAVGLREVVQHRRARVTVDTLDGSANYTVSVNGTAIATTSGSFADADAVLVELKAKITADGTVGGAAGANQVIDSTLLDADGESTAGTGAGGNAAVTLRVYGVNDTDWSVAVSATGTGVLACDADPVSADLTVYFNARSSGSNAPTNGPGWYAAPETYSVTSKGFIERLQVAGLLKGHAFLDNVAGHAGDGASVTYADGPTVYWGPCSLES